MCCLMRVWKPSLISNAVTIFGSTHVVAYLCRQSRSTSSVHIYCSPIWWMWLSPRQLMRTVKIRSKLSRVYSLYTESCTPVFLSKWRPISLHWIHYGMLLLRTTDKRCTTKNRTWKFAIYSKYYERNCTSHEGVAFDFCIELSAVYNWTETLDCRIVELVRIAL
jgi:hypothetical protein